MNRRSFFQRTIGVMVAAMLPLPTSKPLPFGFIRTRWISREQAELIYPPIPYRYLHGTVTFTPEEIAEWDYHAQS